MNYNNLESGQLAGCMYLSSANYMHFGSGNTITFSTSNNMYMNVARDTNVYTPFNLHNRIVEIKLSDL